MAFEVVLTDNISQYFSTFLNISQHYWTFTAHGQLGHGVLLPLHGHLIRPRCPSPQASHENLQLATAVALLKKDTKRLKAMAVEQGLTVPDTVQDGQVVDGQAEVVERPGGWDAMEE